VLVAEWDHLTFGRASVRIREKSAIVLPNFGIALLLAAPGSVSVQIVVAVVIAGVEMLIGVASDQAWTLPTAFGAAPLVARALVGPVAEVARPAVRRTCAERRSRCVVRHR
jgi:hypothetical protein